MHQPRKLTKEIFIRLCREAVSDQHPQDSPAKKEESIWHSISGRAFIYVYPDYDIHERHYYAWLYSADERIPQGERFRSSFNSDIAPVSCEEFDALTTAQRIINEALGRDMESNSLWQ